jgi:hypothetical protein
MALAGHPTGAPASSTTSGSSYADTVHPVHTGPTCFADRDDRSIRLLEVSQRHSDCRCRQGQSKRNRYQLRHYFSPGRPLATTKHCACFSDFDVGQVRPGEMPGKVGVISGNIAARSLFRAGGYTDLIGCRRQRLCRNSISISFGLTYIDESVGRRAGWGAR